MAARCWSRGDEGSTIEMLLVDGAVVLGFSLRRCCDGLGEEEEGEG